MTISPQRAAAKAKAREYLDGAAAGRYAPYHDRKMAQFLRSGALGEALRDEFQALVDDRRSARLARVDRYLTGLEKGLPFDHDKGARQTIDNGYAGKPAMARFAKIQKERDEERRAVIEDFFDHYERTRTVYVDDSNRHPGERLLDAEARHGTDLHRQWMALRARCEAEDKAAMDKAVSAYEDSEAGFPDMNLYGRIMKYPRLYPDFHRRIRAEQKRRRVAEDPLVKKKREQAREWRRQQELGHLMKIPSRLEESDHE